MGQYGDSSLWCGGFYDIRPATYGVDRAPCFWPVANFNEDHVLANQSMLFPQPIPITIQE